MSDRLTEFSDRREWDLTGFTVEQLCLDYRITFSLLGHDSSLMVIIGVPFTLRSDSRLENLIPENTVSLGAILPLLHTVVLSLIAFRDGRLLLQFAGGIEIEAAQDERYESWETHGRGELEGINMLASPHAGPPWYEPKLST